MKMGKNQFCNLMERLKLTSDAARFRKDKVASALGDVAATIVADCFGTDALLDDIAEALEAMYDDADEGAIQDYILWSDFGREETAHVKHIFETPEDLYDFVTRKEKYAV